MKSFGVLVCLCESFEVERVKWRKERADGRNLLLLRKASIQKLPEISISQIFSQRRKTSPRSS